MPEQRPREFSREYRGHGDTAKCPACGWRLDPAAYRCPKCFIYFCFKCRARVMERDPQFQCADQSCPCYGKLLCAACTVMVPEFASVSRIEYDDVGDPERTETYGDNWGGAALGLPIIVGIAIRLLTGSFLFACVCAVAIFVGLAIMLHKFKSTWFTTQKIFPSTQKRIPRTVIENKQVAEHRCCIHCRHPAKALR